MFYKKSICCTISVILILSICLLSSCSTKKESSAPEESVVASSSIDSDTASVPDESTMQENTEQSTNSENATTSEDTMSPEENKTSTTPGGTSTSEIKKVPEKDTPQNPSSEIENIQTSNTSSSLTKQTLSAKAGSSLSYWLYTPQNATDGMPLIIYLHGGSGKGDNLDILMQNDGFPQYLKDGKLGEIPAYIVIPQVPSNFKGWTDVKNSVRDLADYCVATYGTDADRISLTGHSMGGTGTWNLAIAFPDIFSCVAPLSGSISVNDENINALANLPIWAFVGTEDRIVKPDSSIEFISELKKVNDSAEITVFDDADHFSIPELTYLDKTLNVIQWMISKSK